MTKVTLAGNPVTIYAALPAVGAKAPEFNLVKTSLEEAGLKDFAGKKVVLNIFPSMDTEVCAASVRKFNAILSEKPNTVVLCISKDLPFAMGRFCTTEGLENVVSLSGFRNEAFGKDYGVLITDSVLQGLYTRAIVVIDEEGKVIAQELVPEITTEPNYDQVISVL